MADRLRQDELYDQAWLTYLAVHDPDKLLERLRGKPQPIQVEKVVADAVKLFG